MYTHGHVMYKEINCYIYQSRERYIFNHQLSQLKPRFVAEAINLHFQYFVPTLKLYNIRKLLVYHILACIHKTILLHTLLHGKLM